MARETPCSTVIPYVIFFLIATLIIIVAVFLGLIPFVQSPNIQVISLKTSPIIFTPSVSNHPSTIVSATWNLTFIVINPNKNMKLHYKDVNVAVYYQWVILSWQKLNFMNQSEENEVVAQVSVTNSVVLSNQSAATMEKDGWEDLAVNFHIKFRGTVKVYVGTSMGIYHALSIDCDDVKVVFSPQNGIGSTLGPSTNCYSNKLIF